VTRQAARVAREIEALQYALAIVCWHGGSNAVAFGPGPPDAAATLRAMLERLISSRTERERG